ncbi:prepilin-type N-terminal cleavage/methylation domain-containing protein [Shewanella sp. KCT]|uniref:prepilin-type N-terminal cleavage/methylation domain-containing protein n=1 Tax=Shewanella sp. KCT TaxID=2569535 RepID=UPI0011844D31|nr:type II secretion system protein [Shewanella sp. KCT]TVP15752.1 methylation [Shewanella sp. KCT]
MNKQKGFTLIELVVVIIILGILAVTAAPKFINLQSDARQSTIAGMKAAIQGANALIYSKAVIAGKEKEADTSIIIAPGVEVITDYGYLDSEDEPLIVKANLENALDTEFEALSAADTVATQDWGVFSSTNTQFIIVPKGKKSTDACRIDYTTAKDANTPAVVSAIITGC